MGQTTGIDRTREQVTRRRIFTASGAVAIVLAVSVAMAQWLASGTGDGYAKAGSVQPLTTESATVTGDLYPGGTGTLSLRVHNPNPFSTTLTAVSPNGAITSDSAACNDGGHGVTFAGVAGLSLVVPANSSAQFDLPNAVAMAEDSANECQGATFTIPVSVNGGSGGSTSTTDVPADGTPCDDGAPETVNDRYDAGVCTGEPAPLHTYYADNDGDGYGDPANSTQSYSEVAEAGFVANSGDCDDSDASVSPGDPEVSGNGVDDNCDGIIS